MISFYAASLIRVPFTLWLHLNVAVVRRVVDFTAEIEERRTLDRPLPWLCGLLLAALLWWLTRSAWL